MHPKSFVGRAPPGPDGGAYSAPIAGFKGAYTSKGGDEGKRREGRGGSRGGKGKEGRGRKGGRGGEGRGRGRDLPDQCETDGLSSNISRAAAF